MENEHIAAVVKGHLRKLEQLSVAVRRSWGVEEIHEFRVEVKKLRAFMRLAGIQTQGGRWKLPKGLRRFYRAIGEIRNLQLFRQRLRALQKEGFCTLPDGFPEALDRQIAIREKGIGHSRQGKALSGKMARRLLSDLPDRLTGAQKEVFLREKLEVIDAPRSRGDDGLHDLRKAIKDVLYTWDHLGEKCRGEFGAVLNDRGVLQRKSRLLGEYLDIQTAIRLLRERDVIPPVTGHDALLLRTVEEEWRLRQAELRRQIEGVPDRRELLVKE